MCVSVIRLVAESMRVGLRTSEPAGGDRMLAKAVSVFQQQQLLGLNLVEGKGLRGPERVRSDKQKLVVIQRQRINTVQADREEQRNQAQRRARWRATVRGRRRSGPRAGIAWLWVVRAQRCQR